MKKFTGILQVGIAVLLYLISAVAFIDYMYSLTIPDTVTAIENAFGTLVILVAMLVLAKFTLAAGRKKLREVADSQDGDQQSPGPRPARDTEDPGGEQPPVDSAQESAEKGAGN